MSDFIQLTGVKKTEVFTYVETLSIPYANEREEHRQVLIRKSLVRGVADYGDLRRVAIEGKETDLAVSESLQVIAGLLNG